MIDILKLRKLQKEIDKGRTIENKRGSEKQEKSSVPDVHTHTEEVVTQPHLKEFLAIQENKNEDFERFTAGRSELPSTIEKAKIHPADQDDQFGAAEVKPVPGTESGTKERVLSGNDRQSGSEEIGTEEIIGVVMFFLDGRTFGVDIRCVQEVVRCPEITRVPHMPEYHLGVINLRGHIIPVIDSREWLGLKVADRTKETRIIVVNTEGQTMGFLVDAVADIVRVPLNSVQPPPSIPGIDDIYIKGIVELKRSQTNNGGGMMLLLTLDKTLFE